MDYKGLFDHLRGWALDQFNECGSLDCQPHDVERVSEQQEERQTEPLLR
jgi:hypothetical protein